MAVITPPTLTPAPTSPDRADRTTFTARAIALDEWTKNSQVPQMSALGANVYANAVDAATSANAANTSASGAYASAGVATTQAGIATTQANMAIVQAASVQAIDKRYLGSKATAPTFDNQGAMLATGAVYYDIALAQVRIWSGTAWVQGIGSVAGVSTVNGNVGAVLVQPTLVSATNIKTINGTSLLGAGDVVVGIDATTLGLIYAGL